MKNLRYLLTVFVLAAFACKKHHSTPASVPIAGFPLSKGNSWTYQLFDSINNTTDTATFSITDNYMINGPAIYYTTKTVVRSAVVDSGMIIVSGDTAIYQPNGIGLFSDVSILFPLSAGEKWHTRYFGDSVYVLAANINRNVLGTVYDSVYNVGRTRSVPDLYIYQDIFIRPGVGIIEATTDVQPWVPTHKTVKLIAYTVH